MLVIKRVVETVTMEIKITPELISLLGYIDNEKAAQSVMEQIYRNSYPENQSQKTTPDESAKRAAAINKGRRAEREYHEMESEKERVVEMFYKHFSPEIVTDESSDACNSCCEQEPGKYDVENIFTYHSPRPGQPERYTVLRAGAKELAKLVLEACPDSRERDQALTKIEEAVFWANASVARNHNEDG